MIHNSLLVPFCPQLDTAVSEAQIIQLLDSVGKKVFIDHANWSESFAYQPLATASVAHSGTALYIDFFVRGRGVKAVYSANQAPVSRDSCVEFFLQPNLQSPEYWNFEWNCIGAINSSHRVSRENPTRLTDEQIAQIRIYPSLGRVPFDELDGMFEWNLLVVIPFSLIGVSYTPNQTYVMRCNFYKCASDSSFPHYLSWAPINSPRPNFHLPEFFGEMVLL